MDQLKTLVLLENDINLLENKKMELDVLLLNELGVKFGSQIEICKKNIHDLEELKKNDEISIIDLEVDLLDCEEKIKKIDKRLYSVETRDLKELEYLSEEKASCKNNLDFIEDNLLELFEKIELLDIDIAIGLEELERRELQYLSYKIEMEKNIETIKTLIEDISSNIEMSESCLEENILKKYKSIKESKKYGIVEVHNGICKGCNMKLSSSIIDEVKQVSEIVFCENCGRIIYYCKNE